MTISSAPLRKLAIGHLYEAKNQASFRWRNRVLSVVQCNRSCGLQVALCKMRFPYFPFRRDRGQVCPLSPLNQTLLTAFGRFFGNLQKNSFRLHFIRNCLIFGWFRFLFSPPREGFFVSIHLLSRKFSRENRVVLAYYERASVTTIWSQRSLTPKIICIMQKKTYKSINLACTL